MNDKELIDEYDKIQTLKKDIEFKEDEIRKKIIDLAKEKNAEFFFGTHKKCTIKSYEKIVYPEDKAVIETILRNKGLYDRFSSVNYFKLNPAVMKGEIDKEVINLTKKEKAFRVSLIDMGV